MKRLEANTAEKNRGQKVGQTPSSSSPFPTPALRDLPPVITFEFFTRKRWKVGQMVIQCNAMMMDGGSLSPAADFWKLWRKVCSRLAAGVSSYRRPMLWLAHLHCRAGWPKRALHWWLSCKSAKANPSRAFRSHRGRRKHHFLTSSQNCSTAVYSNKKYGSSTATHSKLELQFNMQFSMQFNMQLTSYMRCNELYCDIIVAQIVPVHSSRICVKAECSCMWWN